VKRESPSRGNEKHHSTLSSLNISVRKMRIWVSWPTFGRRSIEKRKVEKFTNLTEDWVVGRQRVILGCLAGSAHQRSGLRGIPQVSPVAFRTVGTPCGVRLTLRRNSDHQKLDGSVCSRM
jgi:hypothetical protein